MLIVGNWKLNGSFAFSQGITEYLNLSLREAKDVDIAVCPPFVYLSEVYRNLHSGTIKTGAQDVSDHASGAFTGEVSADMLVETGCSYVIIGHMERRILYRESESMIVRKFQLAQKAGLIPILCVGETLQQREQGEQHQIIAEQLGGICDICQNSQFSIAYEPGWAIGTGKIASTEQVAEMHDFIYECLGKFPHINLSSVRIIYGGSINADNADSLFRADGVDGGLVGGASLDGRSFSLICQSACSATKN